MGKEWDQSDASEGGELSGQARRAGARALLSWNNEFEGAEDAAERVYWAIVDALEEQARNQTQNRS